MLDVSTRMDAKSRMCGLTLRAHASKSCFETSPEAGEDLACPLNDTDDGKDKACDAEWIGHMDQ